jgi:hydroxyacylglutathione hydrolase
VPYLEDEFGDILQKARDGKFWSPNDLSDATGIPLDEIRRMEKCELIPEDNVISQIADSLNLHAPTLQIIAREEWKPLPPVSDPTFDLICLDVFMGSYPVKCYLIRCPSTGATAIVDTGGNPQAVIDKAKEIGVKPEMILLTHCHPDHAGGQDKLDREFNCPTYVDEKEVQPPSKRDLRFLKDGDVISLGSLRINVLSTPGHTAGGITFQINNTLLSGDVIFAGSMGRANSSWQDLYDSITTRLFAFPSETIIHPGHGPASTVGEEKKHNPFFVKN